jgi:YfiH family protein
MRSISVASIPIPIIFVAMAFPQPSGGFQWVQEAWGPALRCAPLAPVAPHCFTTRELQLQGVRGEDRHGVHALAQALGVADAALVRMRQVHGVRVFGPARGKPLPLHYDDWPEGDIAISDDPSVAVTVRVADCVPTLLADPRTGAVAAIHAGWKGTAAGAVGEAVRALASRFGTRPGDLVSAVGPSIGPCCYEVGHELVRQFSGHEDADRWFLPGTKPRLDLWQATRDQLVRVGVPRERIHVCELCTFDHPALFHSYRRDGTAAGRLVAAIRSAPGTRP